MGTRNSPNKEDDSVGQTEKMATGSQTVKEKSPTEKDVNQVRKSVDSEDSTSRPGERGDGGAPLMSWEELQTEEPSGEGDLDRSIEEELGEIEEEEDVLGTEWTIAKEDKLIDYFERCKFLYDKNNDDYKLRGKKEQTYAAIAKKLEMTGK